MTQRSLSRVAAPSKRLEKTHSPNARLLVTMVVGAFVAFGNQFVEVVVLGCANGFESEIFDDEQGYAGKGLKRRS